MITYLEPDILDYEVKWALGSITISKASGGVGIPVELFQILKVDAVKVLQSMPANLKNSALATGLENTAEFSKFAGILRAALSQHHLLGFEIAQLEFQHLHCLCS